MMKRQRLGLVGTCFLISIAACSETKGLRITGIEPKSGPPAGSSPVTITGSGFAQDGAKNVSVFFGGRKGRVIKVKGDTEITVFAPSGEEGQTVDVVVEFDDARTHKYPKAYTYKDETAGFGVEALGKPNVDTQAPGGTAPAPTPP